MDEIWGVANRVEPGDKISVEYESRRSDRDMTMIGSVVGVFAREGFCEIKFEREDNQRCSVRNDGKLRSFGSNYPVTGDIVDVELIKEVKI